MNALTPSSTPSLPGHIGRFEICAELAAGGMGRVYLGRSTGLGGFEKLVAIKTIHPHLAGMKDFVAMFLDEARIASRCRHPNVCSVLDVADDTGTHYIAMEYLEGESLGALLKRVYATDARSSADLPLLIARIIADACEGLHAAHELRADDGSLLSVVHRDVSPHNIFVCYDGSVRVVDFGVAKAVGRLHTTQSASLKGKLAYMSPEQILHEPVDRRSDLWAMGVTLWEALSLTRLFKRENEGAVVQGILSGDIAEPSSEFLELPEELVRINKRALCRDPGDRYQTAREMADDLHHYIAAQGVPVGISQVSRLMGELFETEKTKKHMLLERVRRGERPSLVDLVASGVADDQPVTASGVQVSGRRSQEPTTPAVKGIPTTASYSGPGGDAASIVEPAGLSTGTRRNKIFGVVAVAVLATGVGVFGLRAGNVELPPPVEDEPAVDVEDRGEASPRDEEVSATTVVLGAEPTGPDQVVPQPRETQTSDLPAAEAQPAETRPRRRDRSASRRQGSRQPSAEPSSAELSDTPPVVSETAVPGQATIDVATPGGWADLYLDGQPAGRSPTRLTVSAGSHQLTLHAFGGEAVHTRRIVAEPGARERVVVRLRSD